MKRIKTITTYNGHAQFVAECHDTGTFLARCQVADIASPYAYSPTVRIYRYRGVNVIWFETSHRRFEVFEVHPELLRFKSEQKAEDWHIRFCAKPARAA